MATSFLMSLRQGDRPYSAGLDRLSRIVVGSFIAMNAWLVAFPAAGQAADDGKARLPAGASRPGIEIVLRRELPAPLATARDVRFDDAGHVFIAAGANGVFRLPLAPGTPAERLYAGGYGQDKVWIASRLAAGSQHLLMAAPVFELVWRSRAGGPLRRDSVLEHVFDVDLTNSPDGERLLLLGTRRTETARSPEGALAWTARLGEESVADLRPLAYSIHGPGPQAMDACGSLNLGHARFLADGSALVVPGAEPGAYLFSPDGMLTGSWDTSALGLEVPCSGLDQEKVELLAADPDARWSWLEQFEIVDEVLDLPACPVLFTRRVGVDGTRWRAIQLLPGGKTHYRDLPFATPSKRSHLQADVLGDRVVFLLLELGQPERPPASAPTLVLTSSVGVF